MVNLLRLLVLGIALATLPPAWAQAPARVTILYDAIGRAPHLKHGWGYSALVEYGGRKILFDTGGRVEQFAANVKALGIDLRDVDFVVLSHRHGDHTSGLNHVLSVNPNVKIYTPAEQQEFHTPSAPALVGLIRRHVETAPEDMHYFDRDVPSQIGHAHSAAGCDQLGDRLMALLGVHHALLTACGRRICVCVVLDPNLLTVNPHVSFNGPWSPPPTN